jgi:MFS family permease
MVDVYLPVVALPPAIVYFQPTTMSTDLASVLFITTFMATMVGRPLGAAVFGHYSDTLGRRRLTLLSIAGFSACTAAIAALPGYASWGVAAPVLLVVLRFVNGVFLGGEYTAGTPLAFEHCPRRARGLFGGLLLGAYTLAFVFISLIVLAVLAVAPAGDAASAYARWGWRVPFLIGVILGGVLLAFRARVPESDMWTDGPKVDRPLQVLYRGAVRRDLAQVLLTMSGLWLMSGSVVTVMPRLLLAQLDTSAVSVTWALLVANLVVFFTFAVAGALSEVVGRRRVLIGGAAVGGTGGLVGYYVVASGRASTAVTFGLVCLVHVLVLGAWGAAATYCNERFPTAVRSSGFGVGYSLSIVVSSFSALYMAGLGRLMPFEYTQLVLLAVGAALTGVGAWLGPETAGIELANVRASDKAAAVRVPVHREPHPAEQPDARIDHVPRNDR